MTDTQPPGELSPAAQALYERLSPFDQAHAQRVLAALRQAGTVSPDLAQAALLHDVGKADAGITLVHRTLVVLLGRLSPRLLQRLAGDGRNRWSAPFYAALHHEAIGAELAQRSGCSPRTVWLIRNHSLKSTPCGGIMTDDAELAALQAADAAS
ncbi:MAG: hypothetical protein GXY52_04210 [Chloroflexi bacterium]|nr:hypothetical protein [Chloroflexota bacterium]